MEEGTILKELENAVSLHQEKMLETSLSKALNTGIPFMDIRQSLIQGLDKVRLKLMSNETSIPDFLLCLDLVSQGLNRLYSLEEGRLIKENDIPLVIGVVDGDPHDLGKNIIAAIYRTCGYNVFDLGSQVPDETFLKTIQDRKPKVLALSAMMSTTMEAIPGIIKKIKSTLPDTVIMVGGAFLDKNLAKSFDADGYSETAITVLEETDAAIKRVAQGTAWAL